MVDGQEDFVVPVQAQPPEPPAGEPSDAKRSIHYLLEAAMQYGNIGGLVDLLRHVAALHQYKPYNAMLVLLQRPAATFVLPAHRWEERYGRVIRPGEQPLVMLQPRGPVMFLFDVSQTEAGPRARALPPRLLNPYAMNDAPGAEIELQWVIENAKADGVRVTGARYGLPAAGCIRTACAGPQLVLERRRPEEVYREVRVRYDVLLNQTYSPTERLATLAHELGHLYCGHLGGHDAELWPEPFWRDRAGMTHELRELEAESVALLVFERLHPNIPLPPHLEQYVQEVPDLAPASVETVLTAAGRVLEMSAGLAPRRLKQNRKAPASASSSGRSSSDAAAASAVSRRPS